MKITIEINTDKLEKGYKVGKKLVKKGIEKVSPQAAKKTAKYSAVVAMFLLPTLGIVNKCSNVDKGDNGNNAELVVVDKPVKRKYIDKYTEKKDKEVYIVKKGDNPWAIAKKYGVHKLRLLAENGLKEESIIHEGDSIVIPEKYTVTNVKNLDDVAKLMGFSNEFIQDIASTEVMHHEIYLDRNGKKTIGLGHVVTPSEESKYEGVYLSDEDIYTLYAQDWFDRDLIMQTVMPDDSYSSLPMHLRESVLDLVFNKGEDAVLKNTELYNAIINQDYVKIISNLTQDYSVVTDAKGNKVKKFASGLNKRRLYDMHNACKIFKKGVIPEEVLKSAQDVYERGLVHMKQEYERGEFKSKSQYENVLAEYKQLTEKWFNGKVGDKKESADASESKTSDVKPETAPKSTAGSETPVPAKRAANSGKNGLPNTPIIIEGANMGWNVSSLYTDWENTAKRHLRPFKRPIPVVDSKGNVIADVKILDGKNKKGPLAGHTIIVNAGHGGCMYKDPHTGKPSVNFDPGTSNAEMTGKNKNIETNKFISNGGKPLEEWIVNQRISEDLTEKLRQKGANVIWVQGSVFTAQEAIRNLQQTKKIDLIVSLHSNSDGSKRGVYVIGNNRGGEDVQDKDFGKKIVARLNGDNWFNGITTLTSQSLGVLSASKYKTSPVPGVLIETGNLKNEKDVLNLNSSDFKNKMTDHIVEGIIDYLP